MTSGAGAGAGAGALPVRLDRRTRRIGPGGSVLVGGEPLTLVRLTPAASALMDGAGSPARLHPDASDLAAGLSRSLVTRGLAHPDVRAVTDPDPAPSGCAVVVPVRDDPGGLARLLDALSDLRRRDVRVVVVDDGSLRPVGVPADVTLVRHEHPLGPAAARNAGVRAAGRPLTVFLDADVVPGPGWSAPLFAHFSDPSVVLVAPRIVASEPGWWWTRGYETARSALDLGPDPALVRPGARVSYVPSAAMAVHLERLPHEVDRNALFDVTMPVAEDVDLCWRLVSAGAVLRYEPASRVAHRHRTALVALLGRRAFYGSGASVLAERHGSAVAPAVFSHRTLAIALLAWWAGPVGLLAAALLTADTARRIRTATGDTPIAVRLAVGSAWAAYWQLCSVLLRTYWPATAAVVLPASLAARRGAAMPRRFLTRIAVAAVTEGLRHWWAGREPGRLPRDEPAGHLVLHRLDDLAYGYGVWRSVLRCRSLAALTPVFRP